MNREPLNRNDWRFIAVCAGVVALSLFIIVNWFNAAFPEASIEFRYDRQSSLPLAAGVLRDLHVGTDGLKHAATFSSDDEARVFLERTIGLRAAAAVMKHDVHLWSWHHRWFKPLQEEEWQIDVAPTGEIISYSDKLPEGERVPDVDAAGARAIAESFLLRVRAPHPPFGHLLPAGEGSDRQLVSTSERRLPRRTQRIFTWESKSIRPGGTPYRTVVTVDGNRVTSYSQRLHVPDSWTRAYGEQRSKNYLVFNIDQIFIAITLICIIVVFVDRLRRGDVSITMLLGFGVVSFVLVTGVALNYFPLALADYDTTTSYPTFLAKFAFFDVLLPAFGETMFLIVLVGSGEPLYRERFPRQLAIPRLWNRRALTSKRVFRSFLLGYTLVAFFLAYQVAFYLIAGHFGAWAPAEVPYDSLLSTRFPWIAVLFAGFFPAMREEFMSRAFSIPFFERVLRSRAFAIVAAAFIWGFGHSLYPNQPFYIRGVEVGLAGVLIGSLLYRFGLLPLLIWHYTVDALYTALLLFKSGNHYYIVSAALSSCVFAIPMIATIALYIRNRGFIDDRELDNATIPTVEPLPARERVEAPLPPAIAVTRPLAITCVAAVALALALIALAPKTMNDVADYRTTREQVIEIATNWLSSVPHQKPLPKTAAMPVEAFRSWDREDSAEDGGKPGLFDNIAAEYLIRHGLSVGQLVDVMRTRVEAATWMVRSYTPLEKREYFVEVDPRTSRVIGYHRYQEERALGARLEQAEALALARGAFASYALDPNAFELKEALNYQQPNRRDWLFHFQERAPLAADAWRRVSVRVAGSEITQFATTIKIPDEVRRKEEEQGLLNFVLLALKIVGFLVVVSLIVTGTVMTTRRGNAAWKDALRWTAFLAVIPLARFFASLKLSAFSYNTTYAWQTFMTNVLINNTKLLALELGGLFLAFMAIKSVYPFAIELRSAEARRRFGRSAALAAVATMGIFMVWRFTMLFIAHAWPSMIRIHGVDVPEEVVLPMPGLLSIGMAIVRTIELSAAIAVFVAALGPLRRKPWIAGAIVVAGFTFVQLDPSVDGRQFPLMLAGAITSSVMLWALVRYVLRDNLLAYPLTIAFALLLQDGMTMIEQHRPDLQANAIAVFVAAAALMIWAVSPRRAEGMAADA